MKRSFLMSALVLALAAAMSACGGGGASGEPAKDGDSEKKDGDTSSDDPVVELKNISEGLQKEVDGILEPIKNADATIDSVAKLPDELKAKKAKFDPKKLMAEAAKIASGEEAAVDALGLADDAKAMVTERFDKLKALVNSVKTLDEKVKSLGGKITDAITKVPVIGGKAVAKAQLALANPLAGAETKKKAEADKAAVEGIIKGFKDKASGWQKDVTDVPAKAKDLPAKMAKAFKK